jgi:multidrug efflux pump subunit AcrB
VDPPAAGEIHPAADSRDALPSVYLGLAFALFLGAAAAVAGGLVKFQFFAFDPIRLYYVNVDMPPDAPIEETLRQTLAVEQRVRARLARG